MIETTEESSREDKQRMAESIYGRLEGGSQDEIEAQVRLMASSSRLKIVGSEIKPPEPTKPSRVIEPPPPYDSNKEALQKMVGKVYERRNQSVCAGIKYTIRDLKWSERIQEFWVVQDYPAMESMMSCRQFCQWMQEYKPKPVILKPEPPAAKPRKTPWSDGNGKT